MKTGTTAIQNFLIHNKEQLKTHGVLFSSVNHRAMNYLAFSLLDNLPPYIQHATEDSKEKLYHDLLEEIKNSKQQKIIISSEAFSLIATDLFMGERAVKQLSEFLQNALIDVKIIAFVRRQDDYMDSQYNQHIKAHNFYDLYDASVAQFLQEKKSLMDFDSVLTYYSKYFGEENLLVQVYKSDTLLNDFCESIGIKSVNKFKVSKTVNARLSQDGLEIMRRLNTMGVDKSSPKKNWDLVRLIESYVSKPRFGNSISSEQAKNIMEQSFESNRRLSLQYLNGDSSWYSLERKNPYFKPQDLLTLSEQEIDKAVKSVWEIHNSSNYEN